MSWRLESELFDRDQEPSIWNLPERRYSSDSGYRSRSRALSQECQPTEYLLKSNEYYRKVSGLAECIEARFSLTGVAGSLRWSCGRGPKRAPLYAASRLPPITRPPSVIPRYRLRRRESRNEITVWSLLHQPKCSPIRHRRLPSRRSLVTGYVVGRSGRLDAGSRREHRTVIGWPQA